MENIIGNYSLKSPYHKNKRLPFSIRRINQNNTAFCETVEYKGWKRFDVSGDWCLDNLKEMIASGFLKPKKG
jgi:hypothetical protein